MKKTALTLSILLLLTLCFYWGVRSWIKSDIDKIGYQAQSSYQGDKTDALIAVLKSDNECIDNKNKAIWALGKLGNKRALPVLESLQVNADCNHDSMVCQREIEKAIDLIEGKSLTIFAFK